MWPIGSFNQALALPEIKFVFQCNIPVLFKGYSVGLDKRKEVKWAKQRREQENFSCLLKEKQKGEKSRGTWLLFLLHSFLHQEFAEVLAGVLYYWLIFLLLWKDKGVCLVPKRPGSTVLECVSKLFHNLKRSKAHSKPFNVKHTSNQTETKYTIT